jgi:hypothetical protein
MITPHYYNYDYNTTLIILLNNCISLLMVLKNYGSLFLHFVSCNRYKSLDNRRIMNNYKGHDTSSLPDLQYIVLKLRSDVRQITTATQWQAIQLLGVTTIIDWTQCDTIKTWFQWENNELSTGFVFWTLQKRTTDNDDAECLFTDKTDANVAWIN